MIFPREIPGEALPDELRENALRPLKRLNAYYQKRDPEQANACIDETMLPEEILLLGTNPGEIFHGRESAKGLLQGDWKYWGKLALDVLNFGYAIAAWAPGLALTVCLMLFGFSWLVF